MVNDLIHALDRLDAMPEAVDLRRRSYELLGAGAGEAVLDVGCGAGLAVAELAALGVAAEGLDPSPEMIGLARRRYPGAEFHLGPAEALLHADGSLRGYRADKVLHAMTDPVAALAEAARVLAPGGRIVVLGQDWGGIAVDSDDPALTRRLLAALAEGIPHPMIARSSRNLLLDAGFRDVEVEGRLAVFTEAGVMMHLLRRASNDADGASWLADQLDRDERGRFFGMAPVVIASGTR
ncbi:methyltransferase domain-containing protein [Allokutzneria sp. A3M-2-11 16]|uniref:methyltransferase domain-containing protein n=1 Tax=Allokutzneria sp. A3M-2-11 16 TaxID=2962043 RepID=UPI0020B7FEC1|nr:methyltransferase domain-containing protein [Allokutzneria sp. A3M-2-11 16]MCP3804825.1 methyltransferase domain-containing protein [Allokutzneria sp. A3M-2-11 16]